MLPEPDNKETLMLEQDAFLEKHDPQVMQMLLNPAFLAVLSPEQRKEDRLLTVYKLIKACNPESPLETMLHIQLLGLHTHAMRMMCEAQKYNSLDLQEKFLKVANKLSRTFSTSLDSLGKFKRKGEQLIRIENVNVNQGGQAVMAGNITRN